MKRSYREVLDKMIWSEQQSAFLDWCAAGVGSCVLEAVAGAGKTTVLMEGVRRIPYGKCVALMAYNKKIADELAEKLRELGVSWQRAKAGTRHSFGFAAWRKAQPKCWVDEDKVWKILEDLIPARHALEVHRPAIARLVSLAKQSWPTPSRPGDWEAVADHHDVFDSEDGPVPLTEIFDLCQRALRRSTQKLDSIDFDDMIYMPLVHDARFWQYDVVMIDEAQDTNAVGREMARRMLRRGGRLIAVGDRHQAIYGFAGADSDSLDLIARNFGCEYLPLTVTYRCPRGVVDFARQWVSHIVAAPAAPEGTVTVERMETFLARQDLAGGSAVLSRVTKPLVALAFTLIRSKIPCRVEGRDVAKSIVRLMGRWKVENLDDLEDRLDTYLQRETEKLTAKRKDARLAVVTDTVETVRVVIEQCRATGKHTVADAEAYVLDLFGDNVRDMLVLSTIHKAKGREWDRVFWLDRAGTCPSRWARQDWQIGQEVNLQYVAATRTRNVLVDLLAAPKKQEKLGDTP